MKEKSFLFSMIVRKENTSLKVYIPKEIAEALEIKEGDKVDIGIVKRG